MMTPEEQRRLELAERYCVLSGWCAVRAGTEREDAASEAWQQWAEVVGPEFTGPGGSHGITDEVITALAAKNVAERDQNLARVNRLLFGEPGDDE